VRGASSLLVLLALACATAAPPPPPVVDLPAPPPPAAVAPAAPGDPSVRPGANREYLRDDLEVEAWIQRFERGGREIFDRRGAILAASGVAPGMAVADVGAGTGLFTMLFAEAAGPTGKVYAVDIAAPFLAHIDAEARRKGLGNIVTLLADGRTAALPPASVDLIFICDAYHHFEYPRQMNASLMRALRPGGALLLIDFKRVPGQSPAWVLEHVRAGQEVFTAELEAAGFQKEEETPILRENYVLRFRKPPGQK
jgi:ubiquinone/menaquinone biosynthesis C-methylase UbiE